MHLRDIKAQLLAEEMMENLPGSLLEFKRGYVGPRTTLEKLLAEIWSQVLDIPQVGIYHNFFDLGGDALRSLQVHYLAQKKGVHFSLQQFNQYPTIHALCAYLTLANEEVSTSLPVSRLHKGYIPG